VNPRPPLPPFTEETARQKVQMAEDAWNSRDPARVSLAYTPDTEWRNRAEFLRGRAEVVEFLTRKWAKEHELSPQENALGLHQPPHRRAL
jgi:nuclear transport factor 2 (NTF2) superfamily protein